MTTLVFILFWVILGLALLSYAAHSFLLVVQETAAGNDAVVWPLGESWHDRLGSFLTLVRMLLVWLALAYVVLALLELPPVLFGALPLVSPVVSPVSVVFPPESSVVVSAAGASR